MTIARGPSGHAVENSIGIAAPAEAVFDYVTDVRWRLMRRSWDKDLAAIKAIIEH